MGIFFVLDTKTLTNTKRNKKKEKKDYGKHFKNRKARPIVWRQGR